MVFEKLHGLCGFYTERYRNNLSFNEILCDEVSKKTNFCKNFDTLLCEVFEWNLNETNLLLKSTADLN